MRSGYFFSIAFAAIFVSAARANIVTSGNITGSGTPYNNVDNPWATGNLTVGNATAPASLVVTGDYVVNNSGTAYIAKTTVANTSSATVGGGNGNSEWNNTGPLYVASGGVGTLNITGGGHVVNADALVGYDHGSGGTVMVGGGTGGATWTSHGELYLGVDGTGTLEILDGGVVSTDSNVYLGYDTGSVGSVTMGGGGSSAWTAGPFLYVGESGSGTLSIVDGSSVLSGTTYVGHQTGSHGTVNVGGGSGNAILTNANIVIGYNGPGTLNIGAGGVVETLMVSSGPTNGVINFDGGTLQVDATDSASNPMQLLIGGGSFSVPKFGTTFTITSAITGVGQLSEGGKGTLELAHLNTYSGNTTVSEGTLKLSGTGSFASSPKIWVKSDSKLDVGSVTQGANFLAGRFSLVSGQTLKGSGNVVGSMGVAGGATVAPGDTVGTLTTGNFSMAVGGTLAVEIDLGPTAGADMLDVGGSISLGGQVLLSLLNGNGAALPRTFLVVRNDANDAISGTFASISGLPANISATLNYAFAGTDSLGRVGDGNDLAITLSRIGGPLGDYNGNGIVDAADYSVWRDSLGSMTQLAADGNHNGKIDAADYDVWKTNFGVVGLGAGAGAAAPEPGTQCLLEVGWGLMGLAWIGRELNRKRVTAPSKGAPRTCCR